MGEREQDPAELADPWDKVAPAWLAIGALVITATVYLPTLFFGFVYDDHWTLLSNGFLRHPEHLGRLFAPGASALHIPDIFRPTLVVFDLICFQTFGLNPAAHHAVSVGMHVAVCGLLGIWLKRRGAPTKLWVATAGLFGVLAIHAEAVAVVSFHEDLLAAALGLGSMIAMDTATDGWRHSRVRSTAWGFAAAALAATACGAKLSAAPLPVVWCLGRIWLPWRTHKESPWPGFVGLLLGTAASLAVRAWLSGGLDPYGPDDPRVYANEVGRAPVLAASLQIHVAYLAQIITGIGLSPEYVDQGASWLAPATIASGVILTGLLGLGLRSVSTGRPVVGFAIVAAMLLAMPTANFIGTPNMRADRFVYLTSAPICMGMAAALLRAGQWWATKRMRPTLAIAPLTAAIIFHGAMAQGASAVYRSDSRLWEIGLRRAPASARARAIRGELLVARVRGHQPSVKRAKTLSRAATYCALARVLDPHDDLPHLCEARVASARQQWAAAADAFTAALGKTVTRRDRALLGLASTTLDLPDLPYDARKQRAVAHANQALSEYPYSAEAAAVAARIHHRLGAAKQARSLYQRASKLRSDRWDVVLWGLELELDLGHPSAAAQLWANAQPVIKTADPIRRAQVHKRLQDARHLFKPPTETTSQQGLK